jgi:hypothetical protein
MSSREPFRFPSQIQSCRIFLQRVTVTEAHKKGLRQQRNLALLFLAAGTSHGRQLRHTDGLNSTSCPAPTTEKGMKQQRNLAFIPGGGNLARQTTQTYDRRVELYFVPGTYNRKGMKQLGNILLLFPVAGTSRGRQLRHTTGGLNSTSCPTPSLETNTRETGG